MSLMSSVGLARLPTTPPRQNRRSAPHSLPYLTIPTDDRCALSKPGRWTFEPILLVGISNPNSPVQSTQKNIAAGQEHIRRLTLINSFQRLLPRFTSIEFPILAITPY